MQIGVPWSHLKEIPNTKLLVSLQQNWSKSAKIGIFDISAKGKAKQIYAFEEVQGCKN